MYKIYVRNAFQFEVPINGRTKAEVAKTAHEVLGLDPSLVPTFTLDSIYFG